MRAWAVALGAFAACFVVGLVLLPWLTHFPFLAFFPALVVASLCCGWQRGAAVLVLSTAAAWFFFIQPSFSFAITGVPVIIGIVGFLLVGGLIVGLVASLADLLRRTEESAKRLDAAKRVQEMLFRELQHRVANNMQLVVSMLQGARREISDPAAVEVIDQAKARITAMAQLHRRLYDPATFADGVEQLLRDLLAEIFRGLPVRVKLDLRAESLSIDRMTALVLLVNEAAVNAAKHVFLRAEGSSFEVSLSKSGEKLRLIMRDDGPGLGPEQTEAQPKTLGMAIMHALAGQLGGSLRLLGGPGTAFSVEFAAA